jgi:hypothetical protein
VDELMQATAIEGRDDDLRPTTMVVLGVADRAGGPGAGQLPPPHGMHTALARADGLRSRFAVLA